ncbi:MAG: hypothetical protein EOM23_12185 [Candidatus Moranbacteria bacterium]|nr:hypothetical protein [Candidatus Moranbacteria bacterium]
MKFWDKGFFIFDQVKKGNIKAFESLFKESYQELCNYSYGFVKDNDVAEEIVQDFFFNFWKNRKTKNINTSLKSYMHTAVKNMSLNFIEKQKVRQRYKDQVQYIDNNLIRFKRKDVEDHLNQQINALNDKLNSRYISDSVDDSLRSVIKYFSEISNNLFPDSYYPFSIGAINKRIQNKKLTFGLK